MSKHESSIKRHMARHGLKSKPKDKPYEYKPKLQRPREDNNLMNVPGELIDQICRIADLTIL